MITHRLVVLYTVMAVLCGSAGAVSVDIQNLALRSGTDLWLGGGSTVQGSIAAGRDISVDSNGTISGSSYAGKDSWYGHNGSVGGSVYAVKENVMARDGNVGGNVTGGSVHFGRDTNVGGNVTAGTGGVSVDRDTSIGGNVTANKNIWIDKNSTVGGNATAGVGKSVETGRNVTIGGTTGSGATPDAPSFSAPALPTAPTTPGASGPYQWTGNGGELTLTPGQHGGLGFGNNATLNLTAGQYDLGEFWMANNGLVNVDTSAGDVYLNFYGDMSTGNNVLFNKTGDGNLFITLFDSDAWLGSNNELDAALRAYNGSFGADPETSLTGTYWATGEIALGRSTSVEYMNYYNGGGGATVPEPMTLAGVLMAASGAGVYLVRRRRH